MSAIIDAHAHVWDGTAAGKDPGPVRAGYSAQSQAPVELLLDYMDEAGVQKAVLVQPWFYQWDNAYLAGCLARYPGRFRGVCVVDPRGAGAPAALQRWRDQGVTGIRLRPRRLGGVPVPGPWLGTDETLPLWEAIAETDTIVCTLGSEAELAALPALLQRLPSVKVVVDHLNIPVASEGLGQRRFQACLALARFPTVFVKIAGFHQWCQERYPFRDGIPYLEAAVKAFGAERCMWASDYPHVLAGCGYLRSRNLLARQAKFLSAEQLKWVMGKTAERLWF